MADHYQVAVIGAGPAGYVAAIRCAQLGMKTLCIDDRRNTKGEASPGGTCLNVGCIPSKALLSISEHYYALKHHFPSYGIQTGSAFIDVAQMQASKEDQVYKLTRGILSLLSSNGVTFANGKAVLFANNRIVIKTEDGSSNEVSAEQVILAPGSKPRSLPGIDLDGTHITDSTGALSFDHVPQRLGIIGAGVIGLELGSVWARLGSKVTILEAMDRFLPFVDHDTSSLAKRILTKQGLDIKLATRTESVHLQDHEVLVTAMHNHQTQNMSFDALIVAVGREANAQASLGSDCGVDLDDQGFIKIDDQFQTSAANVFAVGDAVGGPMLAHKGSEEGVAVAEFIAQGRKSIGHKAMPWIIYTWPEIAWAGSSEEELKSKGIAYVVGKFPFTANARARMSTTSEGFVKIISDAQTDRILGVQMIGPQVSELLSEMILAFEYQASSEDLIRTIHGHPSLSESIHEAALAVHKRALHMPKSS